MTKKKWFDDYFFPFVKNYAKDTPFFRGDQVTAAYREAKLPEPDNHNWFGMGIKAASRKGWYKKAAMQVPTEAHSHICLLVLWRSQLCKEQYLHDLEKDHMKALNDLRVSVITGRMYITEALNKAYMIGITARV
jgi:hypothetical protein